MEPNFEETLKNIGLDATVIKNTLANPKVVQSISEVLKAANIYKCDKKIGNFYIFPLNESSRQLALRYSDKTLFIH